MLLSTLFILAISSSIDSLGIGITYGIKNTKLTFPAKFIIFIISFLISLSSLLFGNIIYCILPDNFINIFGNIILILMGLFILFNSFKNQNKNANYGNCKNIKNITLKIIKDPKYSDFDNSNYIDFHEAIFLALALSLDCFGIGLCISTFNINAFIFPFLISFFQLFFLLLGNTLGKKLNNLTHLPNNIWSIVSGLLLIIIGLIK